MNEADMLRIGTFAGMTGEDIFVLGGCVGAGVVLLTGLVAWAVNRLLHWVWP